MLGAQRDGIKSLQTFFDPKDVRIGREQENGMFSLFVEHKKIYALQIAQLLCGLQRGMSACIPRDFDRGWSRRYRER